jgi:acetoacetate decarboxylase
VAYNLTNITIKGSWVGDARLHLIPHVNAPVADLPVKKIVGGKHFLGDITLPHGRVLHDYLA